VLVDDSNVVVGVSSLVQQNCKAYALSTRVDTSAIQAWLAPYLG
jgi:hypothetical protein